MYKEGDKALVMVKDKDLLNKMKKYLLKRYYLVVESAKDIFEVYKKFENEDMSYELVIIDDTAAGLPTSAHAFKTLKEKSETIVLHLSTLLELVDSNYSSQLRQLKKYPDEIMEEKENEFVGKILKVYRPIFYSPSLADVYKDYCKTLVEIIDVDNSTCVMLRLDEKPLRRGTVMAQYPDIDQEPYEISLEGSQQLKTMVEYFKPIHIPDLNKDEAFRSELLEKFSFPYGSVLMVPIEMNGICLGFFSMFTQKTRRLYRLDDIALSVYTAQVAAGAIVHKFLTEHLHVDMDSKFREYVENPSIFPGRRN
ncbi:MAG: hypothetical protein GTO45_16315 [Candidatus Aminicenantes bacterium]|nr:hypothetical protein [Candidatus Aminicenantes bacterium]NIM78266.1 hypothetical protein [Candidatus Aminicenantes bacterium]NIN19691.1 hypothetical protein [Candidatus Aminicenantes bacterium]NIN43573.1 hypothetical protein [Candidatus Aminicenantes bacterium]NIN86318.1 hypothetical protein [Candidatus Aminicenantes bacterium]